MEQNFIYAPDLAGDVFRCKVPLKDTRQHFIVNGRVQGGASPMQFSLGRGEVMEQMLQLISIRNGKGEGVLSTTSSFRFEEGSNGRILQCFHTFSEEEFYTEDTIEIALEAGSSAEFFILQNEHDRAFHKTSYNIRLAERATLNMVFLSLHGGKIENNLDVSLEGSRAECNLGGLCLTDGRQTMINNINLVHKVADCRSNQLFKGILDDEGVARFFGHITVVKDAQRTEALQANHNILISDKAKAYSKPQLEIYADDVKCSHGSTVGRLDEDEIFYMRTRGIPESEARIMQQAAFAYEVLERISHAELRERMLMMTEGRLRGEYSSCRNCSRNCC